MEHTKGKIETKEEDHQHVGIYPENNTNCLAVVWSDDMFNAEANANEIVRRWNAFEEDGIVDELLEACKYSHTLLLRGMGQSTHAVALLEAVIAKVS